MNKCCAVLFVVLAGSVGRSSAEASGSGGPAVNRVLGLNGQKAYMRVADSQSFHSFENAITIEAWFKAASFHTGDGEVNSIIRKNVAPGAENFLLRFRMVDGEPLAEMTPGLRIGTLKAFHEFTTGTWYHLAGTYDGKSITVYLNGIRIASDRFSGAMDIDKSDLLIGKGDPKSSFGEYFHGELDEIRLWNVARSRNEIRTTMNTPLTGEESGLVAYWNFDGATAKDLSPNGNDGRLYEGARIVEASRPTLSGTRIQGDLRARLDRADGEARTRSQDRQGILRCPA